MSNLGTAFVEFCKTSTDIVAYVGSTVAGSTLGVYPNRLPQNAVTGDFDTPAIVYQEVSAIGQHHSKGASGLVDSLWQVDCYAMKAITAWNLREEVRKHVDGFRGNWGSTTGAYETIHRCEVEQRRTDYDQPADKSDTGRYRYSLDLRIWHAESAPHLGST